MVYRDDRQAAELRRAEVIRRRGLDPRASLDPRLAHLYIHRVARTVSGCAGLLIIGAMARELAGRMESDPRFELAAPVPFSTVCFRARRSGPPEEEDRLNERLLARINAAGPFFLSHTVLRGRYTLRVAIGNLRTTREHLRALWDLLVRGVDAVQEEAA